MTVSILQRPLPYVDALELRQPEDIDLVVVHCTELPDLVTAREYGERIHYPDSGTGNSGHFYIERTGAIEEWVPVQRIAHHVRGYNPRSLGIELVNRGRFPDWFDSRWQRMQEPYPEPQIQGLLALLSKLCADLPELRWIAGHEALDTGRVAASDQPALSVPRKMDPGPLFPWRQVLARCSLRPYETGVR